LFSGVNYFKIVKILLERNKKPAEKEIKVKCTSCSLPAGGSFDHFAFSFFYFMIKIYIVRHGKTDFNEQNRYLGRTDLSLNADGIRQARDVKQHFNNIDIDIVISSPLKRTVETAKIIKPDSLDVISDPAFIERSVGVYEGLTRGKAKQKYLDLFAKNITRIFDEAPTGGETILEVQSRVFAGLNKIKKIHRDKNVLIVTHAFVSKVINKYFNPQISEQDFFNFVLQNAEIKEYDLE